jgi:hypothetical protein
MALFPSACRTKACGANFPNDPHFAPPRFGTPEAHFERASWRCAGPEIDREVQFGEVNLALDPRHESGVVEHSLGVGSSLIVGAEGFVSGRDLGTG